MFSLESIATAPLPFAAEPKMGALKPVVIVDQFAEARPWLRAPIPPNAGHGVLACDSGAHCACAGRNARSPSNGIRRRGFRWGGIEIRPQFRCRVDDSLLSSKSYCKMLLYTPRVICLSRPRPVISNNRVETPITGG